MLCRRWAVPEKMTKLLAMQMNTILAPERAQRLLTWCVVATVPDLIALKVKVTLTSTHPRQSDKDKNQHPHTTCSFQSFTDVMITQEFLVKKQTKKKTSQNEEFPAQKFL